MPLKAKVRYPKIKLAQARRDIHKEMVRQVTEACRTWVIATTDRVPVYTGASKASFLRLAFAASVELAISPVVESRIPLGISTSTGVLIIQQGSRYGFEWSSGLDYINIVDDRNHFLAAGDAALAAFQSQKRIKLPNPTVSRKQS